jgi:hypothetical protein
MKATRKKVDKITAALIAAHRRQEERPFPPGWRQQLMESIRSGGRPYLAPSEQMLERPRPRRLLYMAAGALATIVVGLILFNLDWYDPYINLSPSITIVEKRAEFVLEAGDLDSGLRNLKVTVVQGAKEIELVSEAFKEPEGFWWSTDAVKRVEIPVVMDPESLDLRQGPATLKIAARDLSMRNGSQGRLTILQREIHIQRK